VADKPGVPRCWSQETRGDEVQWSRLEKTRATALIACSAHGGNGTGRRSGGGFARLRRGRRRPIRARKGYAVGARDPPPSSLPISRRRGNSATAPPVSGRWGRGYKHPRSSRSCPIKRELPESCGTTGPERCRTPKDDPRRASIPGLLAPAGPPPTDHVALGPRLLEGGVGGRGAVTHRVKELGGRRSAAAWTNNHAREEPALLT